VPAAAGLRQDAATPEAWHCGACLDTSIKLFSYHNRRATTGPPGRTSSRGTAPRPWFCSTAWPARMTYGGASSPAWPGGTGLRCFMFFTVSPYSALCLWHKTALCPVALLGRDWLRACGRPSAAVAQSMLGRCLPGGVAPGRRRWMFLRLWWASISPHFTCWPTALGRSRLFGAYFEDGVGQR